jgi:hypothetical protein
MSRATPIHPTAMKRMEAVARAINEQRTWIEQCGGTLAGYVARYGSRDDAKHSGHGGEAIYSADMEELRRRERNAGFRVLSTTTTEPKS